MHYAPQHKNSIFEKFLQILWLFASCGKYQIHCNPQAGRSYRITRKVILLTYKEGPSAIRTAINELIDSGYIHRDVVRDKSGRIRGTRHVIFDHRVSPEAARKITQQEPSITPLDVTPNLEEFLIQEAVPEQPPTSQVKPRNRILHPMQLTVCGKFKSGKLTPY